MVILHNADDNFGENMLILFLGGRNKKHEMYCGRSHIDNSKSIYFRDLNHLLTRIQVTHLNDS